MRKKYVVMGLILTVTFHVVCFLKHSSPATGKYSLWNVSGKMENHTRIFFMETSEKGFLSLRQLVAVESSALQNPKKEVVVYLFIDKEVSESSLMRKLREIYPNIRYEFLRISDYLQGSLLEQWYREGKWKSSKTAWSHISDGLRFLELWNKGGIYLDLDMMALKELVFPKNALMWGSQFIITSAALAFQKGHPFFLLAIKDFSAHYDPGNYIANGPTLLTELYKRQCVEMGDNCDMEVLPMSTVQPVAWVTGLDVFKEEAAEKSINKASRSLALHWWNDLSSNLKVPADSKCAFMVLAKEKAPVTWLEIQKAGML